MSVKTRAELKTENAADFPDNTARLISPADLRGQMDDVVDSMFLAGDLDTPGGPASFSGSPVDAADVSFTPVGSISSTNVQAAIQEVSAESGGGSGSTSVFETSAAVAAANISAAADVIETLGYWAAGDGGGAHYVRRASEPTFPGKLQSADGAEHSTSQYLNKRLKFPSGILQLHINFVIIKGSIT